MTTKKLFAGRSRFIVDPNGKIETFYTRATTETRGKKQIQRKMNKELGRVPEAFVAMDIVEIIKKS